VNGCQNDTQQYHHTCWMGSHIIFKINILLVTNLIPLMGFLFLSVPLSSDIVAYRSFSLCLFSSLQSPSSGTNPDRVWFPSIKFVEELKTYKHRTCREAMKVYIPPCIVFVRSPKGWLWCVHQHYQTLLAILCLWNNVPNLVWLSKKQCS
jgi:hypothetical protein